MTLHREMKPTGIEWASHIPAEWSLAALKHVCKFTTGWTPPTGDANSYIGENLWANISDIGPRVLSDTAKRLSDEAVNRHNMSPSPVGALLFSFKLSIGQVSFVGAEMFTNEAIATFHPTEDFALSFAYYALPEMVPKNASENIYGAKMLNQQLIQSATLLVPPLPEQAAIAAFLDRETDKIDTLIGEQQRLIDLLDEKRQAVISHAVTKGLNPDAPMRDTGIQWLGEVPSHWEVAPLKRYWSVTDCKHVTAEFVDEGFPLASIRECQGRFVDLSAAKQTTDEFYQVLVEGGRSPQSGDLIFTRNVTVGRVSQVADWHPTFAMGQDVCLLRRNDDLQSADYLQSALEATSTAQQLEVLMIGSTFKRINVEEIRNLLIAFAPLAEQVKIASYLEHQTTKFDELISTAESTVLLLRERRAALISAAVTGKIDVRGQSTPTVLTPDFRLSRKLVAAKIVEDLAGQKTFGRVKLQKLLYLAEAHSGIHELNGHYVREAAGPLDRDMVREVETALQVSGHVVIEQPEGRGTAVSYQLRGMRGTFQSELESIIGARISALSELIKTVGALDTRGAEAVATLYAVWNDALASGRAPTEDEIIREVLNEWHPKKAETFTAADLQHWMSWMRRNELKPKGNSPITSTGRLFV